MRRLGRLAPISEIRALTNLRRRLPRSTEAALTALTIVLSLNSCRSSHEQAAVNKPGLSSTTTISATAPETTTNQSNSSSAPALPATATGGKKTTPPTPAQTANQHKSETAGSAQKPVKLLSHPEIKTDQVKERQIYEPLHLFGVVEPEFGKETDISSTVSGRVTELFVKPGQSVKAGDSLAVVNSREISELQAELLEARSKLEIARVHENRERHIYHDSMARPKALNEAKAQFKKIKVLKELTEGEYNRQVDLYHEKIAAAKDYLAAKARLEQVKVEYDQAFTELERQESFYKDKSMMRKDLEVAQAETKRAKEHLNTLLQRLTFLGMDKTMEDALMKSGKISGEIKLTTQVSGSISHMDVAVGEMVDPEKSLMKITDLSSMIVSINVPEVDLRAVHLNSKVRIRFAGYPHKVFESKINYIGEHVHLQTRTVTAKAALPANSQGLFKLNMAAQVDVLEPPRTFLACPESAIHDLDGERIAFVQKPDGFELRKIVVGEEGAHYAEILKGLKDGEKVATEGSGRLRRELTAGH